MNIEAAYIHRPPLKYFCWHKASFVWVRIRSAINCLRSGDMSQWETLSCWENSIIQHKTSQWSHFSFHSRIILGLCEKLPVEKRDLTTGKLNIKPSAGAAVFTSDLYVNTQPLWFFTSLSKPPRFYMESRFHWNCMALAWASRWRQTVGHQGVPKSTSIPGSGRERAICTRPRNQGAYK